MKRPGLGYFLLLPLLFISTICVATPDLGDAKLRLSGNLAEGVAKRVSVKQLEAAGTVELNAYNPYAKAEQAYTGVLLSQLVEHFSTANTSTLLLQAIDDYQAEFSSDEWKERRILLVTRINGEHIGLDNKGPAFIVYPDYEEFEPYYIDTMNKWIWMVKKISFK